MPVEVMIEDDRWREAEIEALASRASEAALIHLGLDPRAWEISLLACDDARIALLNADFRGRPAPTNVLSWPAAELAPDIAGGPPLPPELGEDGFLGDVAIAFDTCAREAAEAGRPMSEHITHLVVHSVLHLLGYDHMRDLDATLMEATEVSILGKLGVGDPYKAQGATRPIT